MNTEIHLINWRGGNVQAERLGAKILIMEGFESVDPQCPLGGPDGLKDIICEKNGWDYVAACYFGIDQKAFKDIKHKFNHDLEGVQNNDANGIVFRTNQHITPGERSELIELASEQDKKAIIYHKERIVALLNSPMGYGIRLELFGIEMNKEEQTSFFSQQNNFLKKLLDKQSEYLLAEIGKRISSIKSPLKRIERIANMTYETTLSTNDLVKKNDRSARDKIKVVFPKGEINSNEIDLAELCFLHKLLLFGEEGTQLGKLRTQKVWIGSPTSSGIESATFVPPEPYAVVDETEKLLEWWRSNYESIKKDNAINKIKALVHFHHQLLRIHPFLDGNGRVARFILNQQASELFEIEHKIVIDDTDLYYLALNEGHQGDLESLNRLITQALFGMETLE